MKLYKVQVGTETLEENIPRTMERRQKINAVVKGVFKMDNELTHSLY